MAFLKTVQGRGLSIALSVFLLAGTAIGITPQKAHAADSDATTVTIATQQQLNDWLAETDTDAGVVVNLTADGLTVSSTRANFAGTFNGNDKTLNLSLSTAANNTAFIGNLASTGKLDNVNFSGSVVSTTSGDYVAAAVGYNSGVISNVDNAATVTANSAYNVGGIAGFNNEGTISNCSNAGEIQGKVKVGGMVGENAGTVQDCANTANVTSTYGSKCGIGGIVGRNGDNNTPTETGIVKRCTNSGDVTCANGKWVGGITGFQNALSSTTDCTNTGTVTAYGDYGEIVGHDEGTTTTTPVIGGTATLAGGTVADLQTAIATAGADGTITVTGTVTLSSSVTIHDNVNIVRGAGFTGPMFTVATGDSDIYVTLTSMTIDGNGYGTIFDVNSGRLRLRGNITLQNAAKALNITGGTAEVNKCALGGTVSADVAAAGTFIINNFGGSSVTGTVNLASGAKITLESSLTDFTDSIAVTAADTASDTVIAECASADIANNSVTKLNVNNGIELSTNTTQIIIY